MRELCAEDPPPGLLAYLDGEPVATSAGRTRWIMRRDLADTFPVVAVGGGQ